MLVNNSGASHYSFQSSQTHIAVVNGKTTETTEAVHIQNGKGEKEVVKRINGKKTRSTKQLSSEEIKNIMDRKFMPALFVPCHKDCNAKQKHSTASASAKQKLLRKTLKHTKKHSK